MFNNIFLETPILHTLEDYLSKNPVRMHVPFHTGIPNNSIFPKEIYNLDISEVSGYDISGDDNPIFRSEKITAECFRVSHSFYLTGGASIGLLAALIALNKHGKKVILARNVHKSVINGVVLSGLEPIWLGVDFLEDWGIFSKINLTKLEEVVSKNHDIAGCVIVSPTYEGVISDISAISRICHRGGFPLIVDEAHGGHLYFLNDACHCEERSDEAISKRYEIASPSTRNDNKTSSTQLDADLVIQSWHKSLGSLTQSGVLHLVNERFFTYSDLKRSLDLVSSTSPSFLLLLSLELTRKHLFEVRGAFLKGLLNNSKSFLQEINKMKNIINFKNDDPFKIYLKALNMSGVDFAYRLYKEYSIEIESANEIGFLMQLGVNFNELVKHKVLDALSAVSCIEVPYNAFEEDTFKPCEIEIKSNPRQAFILGFKEKNLEYNSEINATCPPGYVINIPGSKKCS